MKDHPRRGRFTRLLTLITTAWLAVGAYAGTEGQHAGYVGSQACAECHGQEHRAWSGSHHDLAMQVATDDTVLGDFDDAEFVLDGVTTRFFRRDGRFVVNTPGPDGRPADFVVRYVFGVAPLQQLLLELPGGRLQAFGVAWDARPSAQGGQRWYHLYPDDPPRPGDRLHWTGLDQNWNHMCAECHSTDLLKHYDPDSDTFATSYAEINVGCEACHGPGERHVAWAKQPERDGNPGLSIAFDERAGVTWSHDETSGQPRRSTPRTSAKETGVCARCHARRSRLTEAYRHGAPVGDSHRVSSLSRGLYQPDGQVLEEVYVYGSFLQSRMNAAGVTCSDCHDPHSLQTRAEGDALCATCHLATRYASRDHHHHDPGREGARCVACHMPPTTYMGVDPRRDHSFRIPRPDLSVEMGVSNPCTGCHADRDAGWAAAQAAEWRGDRPPSQGYPRHGRALHLADRGVPAARDALVGVAGDPDQSAIARASAMEALGPWLDARIVEQAVRWLDDRDSLVRRAAVDMLAETPPGLRVRLLAPRLDDPVREVRQAAALALSPLGAHSSDAAGGRRLAEVVDDYRQTLGLDADRPEAQHNLALLLVRLRDLPGAEVAYRRALRLDPGFVPAAVNLADLLRETGRDEAGGKVLEAALDATPGEATLLHARGLWLVRQGRGEEAMAALRRATEMAPDNARFGFVLAVALHGADRLDDALAELDRVLAERPYDPDSLAAAVLWRRMNGRRVSPYAERLLELQQVRSGP